MQERLLTPCPHGFSISVLPGGASPWFLHLNSPALPTWLGPTAIMNGPCLHLQCGLEGRVFLPSPGGVEGKALSSKTAQLAGQIHIDHPPQEGLVFTITLYMVKLAVVPW